MLPVPNLICFPSILSSSPSSISAALPGCGVGNLGSVRLETNAGNNFNSSKISGLAKSGLVHVLMYSASSPSSRPWSPPPPSRLAYSSPNPVNGLGGSESKPAADELANGRESDEEASTKGSDGALARVVWVREAGGGICDIGCDWERAWIVEDRLKSFLWLYGEGIFDDDTSSKARAYQLQARD